MHYERQIRRPHKTPEGPVVHICKVTRKPYDTVHFHLYKCKNCRLKTVVKWKSYHGDLVVGSELQRR